METWDLLFDILLLLTACLVSGAILARFGQSPLVGYLLAGMFLGGPGSAHVIHSEHTIESIAELGVSLLLFSLGLEFSWQRVRALGGRVILAGALQVAVTAILAALLGYPLTSGVPEAIAIGAMISLSSTACVLRVLMDRAEVESAHGRNTLAVLLVQDMAVVPLAILVTLLGRGGTPLDVALDVGRILLLAVALVLGLYVSLNKIAVRALGTLTLERNRELTLVLAVIVGLGSAWIAHRAGISPSLGAFVSGMFLGSSPFATQIRSDVSSLRTILLTLFFGAAGMVANPLWIAQHPLLVLGVTIIVIAGKMLVVWAIFRGLGQPHQVAAATGICLAQVGEFAFVLGSIGLANGVISFETELLVVSVTITTLFVSPFLTPQAVNLGTQFTRAIGVKGVNRLIRPGTEHDHPRVIIVGFGPAGQSAAEPFENQPDLVHILDLSRRNIARAKSMGFSGHIGDAAQAEVLEHVHVASALAVVVTIPDQIGAMRVLQEVRRLAPHAHLIVRSRYQRYTQDYAAAGASVVVGDEEEAGAGIHRAIQHWLQSQPMHADPESPGKKIWNLKYQHPESA